MSEDKKTDIDLLIPPMVQAWIRTMLNPDAHVSERHAMRNNITDLEEILKEAKRKFDSSMCFQKPRK